MDCFDDFRVGRNRLARESVRRVFFIRAVYRRGIRLSCYLVILG